VNQWNDIVVDRQTIYIVSLMPGNGFNHWYIIFWRDTRIFIEGYAKVDIFALIVLWWGIAWKFWLWSLGSKILFHRYRLKATLVDC
jgi:hypothetical protein